MLIAAVVIAGAVGVALGVGLSALSGDEDSSDSSGASTTATTTEATKKRTRTQTSARTSTAKAAPEPRTATDPVRLQVVSAILRRAVSASGRARNRARLSVRVRVTNRGTRTLENVNPILLAGGRVRPDRLQRDAAGSLLRPIRQGKTGDGVLRFETARAVTSRLAGRRRARLRIAGKTVALTVRIGTPARSKNRQR